MKKGQNLLGEIQFLLLEYDENSWEFIGQKVYEL